MITRLIVMLSGARERDTPEFTNSNSDRSSTFVCITLNAVTILK